MLSFVCPLFDYALEQNCEGVSKTTDSCVCWRCLSATPPPVTSYAWPVIIPVPFCDWGLGFNDDHRKIHWEASRIRSLHKPSNSTKMRITNLVCYVTTNSKSVLLVLTFELKSLKVELSERIIIHWVWMRYCIYMLISQYFVLWSKTIWISSLTCVNFKNAKD